MKQYEVQAPIQLSNKKIAEFGAIVSEKQLHDNAEELVNRGFIKEVLIDEKVSEIEVKETETYIDLDTTETETETETEKVEEVEETENNVSELAEKIVSNKRGQNKNQK